MLTEFGKIFIFFLVAILFVVVAVLAAKILRPSRPTKEKLLTYECGENAEGSPWVKFNIRFYVVALIFLIFDVEVVLLIPWAMVYKQFGIAGFLVWPMNGEKVILNGKDQESLYRIQIKIYKRTLQLIQRLKTLWVY